jgi:hypothetical protein
MRCVFECDKLMYIALNSPVILLSLYHITTTCDHFRCYSLISLPVSRDSSVGIPTSYGLEGPAMESRWGGGEIFRTRPDRP